jgi:tRNA(fMet)-specific endonuclease VapC
MEVALDSNVLWDLLGGDIQLNLRIKDADPVSMPLPVYAEARFTVLNSGRRAENQARLERFLLTCRILSMTARTAELYAEIRISLKRRGRPIPDHDIWIAAVCLEHNLPLATRDSDFQHVDGLVVLNW